MHVIVKWLTTTNMVTTELYKY